MLVLMQLLEIGLCDRCQFLLHIFLKSLLNQERLYLEVVRWCGVYRLMMVMIFGTKTKLKEMLKTAV